MNCIRYLDELWWTCTGFSRYLASCVLPDLGRSCSGELRCIQKRQVSPQERPEEVAAASSLAFRQSLAPSACPAHLCSGIQGCHMELYSSSWTDMNLEIKRLFEQDLVNYSHCRWQAILTTGSIFCPKSYLRGGNERLQGSQPFLSNEDKSMESAVARMLWAVRIMRLLNVGVLDSFGDLSTKLDWPTWPEIKANVNRDPSLKKIALLQS